MIDDCRRSLRRTLRAKRRGLSPADRRAVAYILARRIAGRRWFMNSRTIAVYLPDDGEIDLVPLISRAWSQGKRIYLPRLFGPRLWFLPYRADTALVGNRLAIPEPVVGSGRRIQPLFLDLVLLPLVAFDRFGNRLGRGGGYYDRTFAALRHRTIRWGPKLVGVGYEFQRVETLAAADWDVPLDAVVTERTIWSRE